MSVNRDRASSGVLIGPLVSHAKHAAGLVLAGVEQGLLLSFLSSQLPSQALSLLWFLL